jgi:CHAT domain-containing protein/Tfp pilus assembly protein PilF
MLTHMPQRTHLLHSFTRPLRHALLLFLALSLLTVPLAAQTEQETVRAIANQLLAEANQLIAEGSKESLQQALQKFTAAQPLFHSLNDRSTEALVLLGAGTLYDALGDRQQAVAYYNQALPLYRAINEQGGAAAALNKLGETYSALGERQKALAYFNEAVLLYRAVSYPAGEAMTLNNIGKVYLALGDPRTALYYFNKALPLRHAVGDRNGEATTLNNIGASYNELGEKEKALDYCKQALELIRPAADHYREAALLNNIGTIYSALGQHQKALDYFGQALPLRHAVGDRKGEATTLNNIGAVYTTLGESQKALAYYNQALPLRRAIRDRDGEAVTLGNISFAERETGALDDARAHVEAALALFESLRTDIGSQELRLSFFANAQTYYEFYIGLLMRAHAARPGAGFDAKALHASERARARSLLELLAEARADIRQGVDPQLVARESALRRRLSAGTQRQLQSLRGIDTDEQGNAAVTEVESLTTELQQVEAQIRQTSPRYATLTQPQPLTLAQIRTQVLDTDTLLLEYSLGDERSYLWAATPTEIKSYELPKRAEIEAAAEQFYKLLALPPEQAASVALKGRGPGAEAERQARAQVARAAAQLSRMLLRPVASLLGKKRLLVVANGALQSVPFAALPSPTSNAGVAATPLVVEHEIVNLPSASTLAVLRQETRERKPAPKTLAVLADPVFESSDVRFKARAEQTAGGKAEPRARTDRWRGLGLARLSFRRLPGTRDEAEAIVKFVPPTLARAALGFAANRALVDSGELGQYRYVHFATHGGLFDRQHPELASLVLSLFDEQGTAQEDGFLLAPEIFNLKLNADVVVLSACETGLGKDVRGEGLVGLTRGFMYAGAPRVVVSLWNVDDAATAELMTRFYRGMLVEKLRPAQALQRAQVSMWQEKHYSAPFYWAAFTLQGEWR